MARAVYKSLLEDLRHNEVKDFRYTLDSQGLPQDDHWYDYDLLMKALRLNRKRMVNYLLDKKCRVNKPRHLRTSSNTPLHLAADKLGWSDVVEKMLRLKARVTDVNADGNTPLHLAFINHHSDRVINRLLRHYISESFEDIRNKDGLGFMHIACTRADLLSVKEFFDVGMSDIFSQVDSESNSIYAGYSPLHFAVEAGKHEIVDFLCKWEADVYAQDRNRSTPLHLALEKQDAQMIDILFYYDSKYENYANNYGVTHFMAACAGSDPGVVEEYVSIAEATPGTSAKALFNHRIKDIPHIPNAGYTALHFACEYGRSNTVYGLLKAGAGEHCLKMTTHGLTPHNLAAKQQHMEICQLIEMYYYEILAPQLQQQQEQLQLQQQQLQLQQQLQQQQQQQTADLYYNVQCSQEVNQMQEQDLVNYCQALQIAC